MAKVSREILCRHTRQSNSISVTMSFPSTEWPFYFAEQVVFVRPGCWEAGLRLQRHGMILQPLVEHSYQTDWALFADALSAQVQMCLEKDREFVLYVLWYRKCCVFNVFFHLHDYYVYDVYYYAYISYVKIKKKKTFRQWLFHLLVFRCPVHLPHLPPWEPSRPFIGDRERQLLSATLEADGLHLASASQRRAVWKLHSTDPLPVWLFRFVRGIQHHLLWWEYI